MKKITILIIDDHKLIREAWSAILDSDGRFEVIAEANSAEEAEKLAGELQPDIVILDINLPGITGIQAIPLLKKISPNSKIVGISMHTQPSYARKMLKNGASAYVTKNSKKEEMFRAIVAVHSGEKYVCDEIKNILSEQSLYGDETPRGLNALSDREVEIIQLVKKGLSSKEIAANLQLCVKTVEVHRYNVMKKLQLRNTAALVDFINHDPEF